MRSLLDRTWRSSQRSSRLVIVVLVASMGVAAVLALQAIQAARERHAISEATLRQYAQLAAWEYSRVARRDIEQSLSHTLQSRAHPRAQNQHCDCDPIATPDAWFQVTGTGEVRADSDAVRAALAVPLAGVSLTEERGDTAMRILALTDDPSRFIALRPEPHLPDGGYVGLIGTVESLAPALSRAHRRSSLLPALLTTEVNARPLVDLKVVDRGQRPIFQSAPPAPGPYVIEADLLPGTPLPLATRVSMTPAFIEQLGLDPGTFRTPLVVILVVVNALLMLVAMWQLRRERELATLRGNFVAGVSHELRTPLAQIRMFSETLLLNRVRNADESKRALEIISQESIRLSQLVDNVLLFHRNVPDAEAAPSHLLDLTVFLRDVVDSFAPLAASKEVRIELDVPSEPVRVLADAGRLRQVLLNLLDNAVKFGPSGQVVRATLSRRDQFGVITVADSGPGVALGDRHRVFAAFQRGRDTRGTGGAGIGLAVVKQIVEEHHGTVSIDDSTGVGAQFRVELPIADSGA